MLRSAALVLFAVATLLVAFAFAALNEGPITVDLGLANFEVQKSVALTLSFAFGWIFGIGCVGALAMRQWFERRRLARALRLAESEVDTLRRMPVTHAD